MGRKGTHFKLIGFAGAASLLVALTAAFFILQAQVCPPYQTFYNQTCTFCKIIAKLAPAQILYEDDLVIAIEKVPVRRPAVDCLIIPKKHIANCKFMNLDEPCEAQILVHLFKVAQILSKRLGGNGDFKIVINNGPEADQTIPHLHLHFKSPDSWSGIKG